MNDEKLTEEQRMALRQKDAVLDRGTYATIPHKLYREELVRLGESYSKADARDMVFLYTYLHAYVNGTVGKTAYMWAFPNVAQIAKETGIHKDRIKPLVDAMEAEGLLLTRKIPWYGNTKKMYMPLVPDRLL